MRRSRFIAALVAVPLLVVITYATAAVAEAIPSRYTVSTCQGQHMDIYPLASAKGKHVPAVLYVHGGAWRSGSRRDSGDLFPALLPDLRGAGVVVAAADYRLAGVARWPAPENDITCAIDYLRGHAGALGIDPNRIRLYGTSAGGHISTMLALAHERGVDRVADMYGPADLTTGGWNAGMVRSIRREFGAQRAAASPARNATPRTPSLLVVQGDCDTIVPVSQSRKLVKALRAAADDVRYIEVHNAGHAFAACGDGPPQPALTDVLTQVSAFLTA